MLAKTPPGRNSNSRVFWLNTDTPVIGRQQVRGELDPWSMLRPGPWPASSCDTGHVLDQQVTLGEQHHQRRRHDVRLALDDPLDVRPHPAHDLPAAFRDRRLPRSQLPRLVAALVRPSPTVGAAGSPAVPGIHGRWSRFPSGFVGPGPATSPPRPHSPPPRLPPAAYDACAPRLTCANAGGGRQAAGPRTRSIHARFAGETQRLWLTVVRSGVKWCSGGTGVGGARCSSWAPTPPTR